MLGTKIKFQYLTNLRYRTYFLLNQKVTKNQGCVVFRGKSQGLSKSGPSIIFSARKFFLSRKNAKGHCKRPFTFMILISKSPDDRLYVLGLSYDFSPTYLKVLAFSRKILRGRTTSTRPTKRLTILP